MCLQNIFLFLLPIVTFQVTSQNVLQTKNSPLYSCSPNHNLSPFNRIGSEAFILTSDKDRSVIDVSSSFPPFITGLKPSDLAASKGLFTSLSSSPILPNILTIGTEVSIDGNLAIGGNLPFLGTVRVTATIPTAGNAAVAYSSQGAAVEMTTEDVAAYLFVDEIGRYGLA